MERCNSWVVILVTGIAAAIRMIFAQPTGLSARAQVEVVRPCSNRNSQQSRTCCAKQEVTAFADFSEAHWRTVWNANPVERSSREVKSAPTSSGSSPTPLPAPAFVLHPDQGT